MYHVAFTPEYSPSNALSAKADTLTEAIATPKPTITAIRRETTMSEQRYRGYEGGYSDL